MPRGRQEVTNSLKKNKKACAESYLPASLEHLFKCLEKNTGDIQEALYISVIVPNNNNKVPSVSNVPITKNEVIPAPLTNIIDRKMYQLSNMNSDMLLKEVQSKQDAEDNIRNIIPPKLLETVIVFQKN